jgi:hypothetical protein
MRVKEAKSGNADARQRLRKRLTVVLALGRWCLFRWCLLGRTPQRPTAPPV